MPNYAHIIEALKSLPQTGDLDGLEALLKKTKAENSVAYISLPQASLDELAAQFAASPALLERKTSGGKNLLHLVAEYMPDPHMVVTMATARPAMLDEKESALGLTPIFQVVINNQNELLKHLSTCWPHIAQQKDDLGQGLPFWCSGHGGGTGLAILQQLGVDIFAPTDGKNILQAACIKYMQQAIPDEDAHLRIADIASLYLDKFAKDDTSASLLEQTANLGRARSALADMIRASPATYAPLISILPTDEAVRLIKTERLNCNSSKGSNAATHILLFHDPNVASLNRELRAQLLDKTIMGDKAANPAIAFSLQYGMDRGDSPYDGIDRQTQRAAFFHTLHEQHGLSAEEMNIRDYYALIVKRAVDGAAMIAFHKEQGAKFITPLKISPDYVNTLLAFGADVTHMHEGKTMADIAVECDQKELAGALKKHIDAKLDSHGMQAGDRIKLEREQGKLSAYLGTTPSP